MLGEDSMDNDYIMRQIKLAGEGFAKLFKKDISKDFLGEVHKDAVTSVSRMDLVLEYINTDKYYDAFILINDLKLKMSYFDFQQVTDWFIKLLREKQQSSPDKLNYIEIEYYKERLNDIL